MSDDGTWTAQPASIDADVEVVLKAADDLHLPITPAVATGVAIIDHLDPAVYAALMARIDSDKA